jgi:hypothetical protein
MFGEISELWWKIGEQHIADYVGQALTRARA